MPSFRRPERKFSTLLHIALCTAALLVNATGCGGGANGDRRATGDTSGAAHPFRVALLTPGPISDQSWNGGAYQGLLRIRDSLGAQVSHIQTRTPAEFEENFRQYGAQGYDLVFGHGFEFQDAAVRVAPDYPKTVYVTTSGNRTGANVAGMEFAFGDASYLAGVVAGAMTKTKVVGTIGGTELPPVQKSFAAFADGAHAVDPAIRVLGSYIGDWDNASAGKEQAIAQIGQRADVIFQNADAAGLGVFQAARERKGVWVIGSNANQNGVAPEVTLGSVVIDLPHALLSVAREVKERRFTPRVIYLGTSDDVVQLVLNPATRAAIPAATVARVDSLDRLMRAGKLHVEGRAKSQ